MAFEWSHDDAPTRTETESCVPVPHRHQRRFTFLMRV